MHFGNLRNRHVTERLDTPFDMKIYHIGFECDLEDELNEIHMNLEAKELFKNENLREYWSNINIAIKNKTSELQPNQPYLQFHVHIWLKLVLAT